MAGGGAGGIAGGGAGGIGSGGGCAIGAGGAGVGGTFSCGTLSCSAGQYCYKNVPGYGGSTSYSCVSDSNCAAGCADCTYSTPCYCACFDGHVLIQCNGI